MGHVRDLDFLTDPEPVKPRDVHAVMTQLLEAVPADHELARIGRHVLASLVYKAPEIAWDYASGLMANAFYGAEQETPRPEWFDKAVEIWLGKPAADERQEALENAHDQAEALLGDDR